MDSRSWNDSATSRPRRLAAPSRQTLEELKDDRHFLDESLAVVAHELRGPLTCIRTAVQCLRLKQPTEVEAEQAYNVIERQVDLMARLVNDLLEVARLRHGKLRVEKRVIELADIVQAAIDASRPLLEARRHSLAVSLPAEPVRLYADPARLIQVVTNLLNNAAKYTPEGGHVWLSAARDGTAVVLRIRDDGIGLSREMLPHVFAPFVQGELASRLSEGGLGIGLTVAKELVEVHGGSIEAFSRGPGEGSEFVVRLPAAEGTENGNGARPTARQLLAAS